MESKNIILKNYSQDPDTKFFFKNIVSIIFLNLAHGT